jgi:hypothetical protein
MTIEQARKLIGNLVACSIYAEGITDEKPTKIEASLADIIEANRLVKEANDAAREKQRSEGGSCSIQMIIADRGIAAMYAAANFAGGSPGEPNIIGYANGNYIMVIHERHMTRTEEEEES